MHEELEARALLMSVLSIRRQVDDLRREVVALDLPIRDAHAFLDALSDVESCAEAASAALVATRRSH